MCNLQHVLVKYAFPCDDTIVLASEVCTGFAIKKHFMDYLLSGYFGLFMINLG